MINNNKNDATKIIIYIIKRKITFLKTTLLILVSIDIFIFKYKYSKSLDSTLVWLNQS